MPAFDFLKNPVTKKWTILAPRRAKRPDFTQASSGKPNEINTKPICPFCPERLVGEEVLYSHPIQDGSTISVIPNKFPFAPIHELVINTPKHDLDLAMLSVEHLKALLEVYKHRFNEHHHAGQVYIFHNHGEKAGESIPHSHTQIAVLPEKVFLDAPQLSSIEKDLSSALVTDHFMITCPETSQWPDEVWVAPKARGKIYGEITEVQAADLAHILSSLVRMFDLRYQKDFPFNFYIYPGSDWYLRIIPRNKVLGGVEVGTGVFINTQRPSETIEFIRTHFITLDPDRLVKEHLADYDRAL